MRHLGAQEAALGASETERAAAIGPIAADGQSAALPGPVSVAGLERAVLNDGFCPIAHPGLYFFQGKLFFQQRCSRL
jgi:hypothetical protein